MNVIIGFDLCLTRKRAEELIVKLQSTEDILEWQERLRLALVRLAPGELLQSVKDEILKLGLGSEISFVEEDSQISVLKI